MDKHLPSPLDKRSHEQSNDAGADCTDYHPPKTMSQGGVAGMMGAASVGGMPRNSSDLSVSRKALFMRLRDSLQAERNPTDCSVL